MLGCASPISAGPSGSMLGLANRGCHRDGKGWRKKGQAPCYVYSSCITPAMPVHVHSCSSCRIHFAVLPTLGEPTSSCCLRDTCTSRSPLSEFPLVLHVPPLSSDTPAQLTGGPPQRSAGRSSSSEKQAFQPLPFVPLAPGETAPSCNCSLHHTLSSYLVNHFLPG